MYLSALLVLSLLVVAGVSSHTGKHFTGFWYVGLLVVSLFINKVVFHQNKFHQPHALLQWFPNFPWTHCVRITQVAFTYRFQLTSLRISDARGPRWGVVTAFLRSF